MALQIVYVFIESRRKRHDNTVTHYRKMTLGALSAKNTLSEGSKPQLIETFENQISKI